MSVAAVLINEFISRYSFETYLEIGCFQDGTFRNVEALVKLGVDPNIGGTHQMSSDFFFNHYRSFHNQDFSPDIVFIDGMHEREQVKRDVLNSLKILQQGGVIVVHDCLPKTVENQLSIDEFIARYHEHPPAGRAWNGDVWKGITDLRVMNQPDIVTLDREWGFGIVVNRVNSDPIAEPLKLSWEIYEQNRDVLLNVVRSPSEVFAFIERIITSG